LRRNPRLQGIAGRASGETWLAKKTSNGSGGEGFSCCSTVVPQNRESHGANFKYLIHPITANVKKALPIQPDDAAGRKMAKLRKMGLFGLDTKGAVVRRACTAPDLRQAYSLVHDVFLGTGFLHPAPNGIRLRIYETTPETATFIAEKDNRVVGVLSVVGDSPELGLPSDAAFQPELDRLRATGARICELTNQAVAPEFRNSAVPTELMRCAIAHSIRCGFHEGVATVSPGHNGFYELLGFRALGGLRSYSKKLHDPVVGLALDLEQYRRPPDGSGEVAHFVHEFATRGNHFLARVSEWTRQARRQFLCPELLQELFVGDRNFLAECSPIELAFLQRHWGEKIFRTVTGAPEWQPHAPGLSLAVAKPSASVEAGARRFPVGWVESYTNELLGWAGRLLQAAEVTWERVQRVFAEEIDSFGSDADDELDLREPADAIAIAHEG